MLAGSLGKVVSRDGQAAKNEHENSEHHENTQIGSLLGDATTVSHTRGTREEVKGRDEGAHTKRSLVDNNKGGLFPDEPDPINQDHSPQSSRDGSWNLHPLTTFTKERPRGKSGTEQNCNRDEKNVEAFEGHEIGRLLFENHVVSLICRKRVLLRREEQEHHHGKEDGSENQELENDRLLVFQVHEDQRYQGALERSDG